MTSETSERALFERLSRGDPAAFSEVYRRCSGRAYAVARAILRSLPDAEEVVQETFLRVWQQATEFDPARGSIEAWVVTIAQTKSIDRLRSIAAASRALAREKYERLPLSQAMYPFQALELCQDRERLQKALSLLPSEQRGMLELAYVEQMTHQEISEHTGDPLGTVKTRLRLGLSKLATQLDAQANESGPVASSLERP